MKKILFIIFFITHLSLNCDAVKKFLVFGGKSGWMGQMVVTIIKDKGHLPICAESRLENRNDIIAEIKKYNPNYIINAAGITGNPNVDWCETHKQETLRANILGTLNLIDIAFQHNIHVTNLSTGCIYEYDEKHKMNSGNGFTEEDEPNFDVSFYSRYKIIMEKLILNYPNVLNLRIKKPISSDYHPKSFVTKILNHKKVINLPNSLAVLDDVLPIAIEMTLKEMKGNFNCVNPGSISHNEVLDLYKEIVDPTFKYVNFSDEELKVIYKNRRSNAILDTSKLQKYFFIPNIKDSLKKVFLKMKNKKKE